MSFGLKFWAGAACLMSLSVLVFADDLPCKDEKISDSPMKDVTKKCKVEWPKGRAVKKECQPSCIQKELGWVNARLHPVTDKSAIVASLLAGNFFPEKVAEDVVDLVFKNECAAIFDKDATCQSHLEFGECIIKATIEVCGLPADFLEDFKHGFKAMYEDSAKN